MLDGDEWVITGQKVWTTLAHRADWCFVVCRTDPESSSHHGLSYLLCPMHQPGVEVRPLRQMTGSAEFNEVFFDGARTAKENVLGPVGEGWKVAMATLGFERGTAFLSQQLAFEHEVAELLDDGAQARRFGRPGAPRRARQPLRRSAGDALQRDAHAHARCSRRGALGPEASIGKLFWTSWHRRFGETAMDVIGADALLVEHAERRRIRARRPAPHLHGEPRGDDLRRLERDPTQHHR